MVSVKRGDRVLIETQSYEVFEGNVYNISKDSIDLDNIYLQTTSTKCPGIQFFFWDEIRSVTLIGDSSSDEAGSFNGYVKISKRMKLCPHEFDRLKEMTVQFILIDKFGKTFNDAIEVLSNRESVAVAGLGNTFQRNKPLGLLLMSDFKQIYIFDIESLTYLKDLKYILESEYITKVVHGGEALFDCLYHRYKLEMVNVCDTQVIDSMMSKTENNVEVRNLPECLNYHFNFPLALLSAVMGEINLKRPLERPLKKAKLLQAAHLVAYLLTLKDHLVKKILKPYSEATLQKYAPYKQDIIVSKNSHQ